MSLENFSITPAEDLPNVSFDATSGKFEISGMSRPEDVTKVYNPMIEWLKQYANSPAPTTVIDFKYAYFNTASARKIYEVLAVLDDINSAGTSNVTINWYYDDPDIDMKMAGEEFDELLELDIKHHSVAI